MPLTDTERIERLEHDVVEIANTHLALISELRKRVEESMENTKRILMLHEFLLDALLVKGVLNKSDLKQPDDRQSDQ